MKSAATPKKRVDFSEVTGGRALCFRNSSMGKQQVLVSSMNRNMDVFFLKPKKHLLLCRLKMLIKSRGLLYWNSHIL